MFLKGYSFSKGKIAHDGAQKTEKTPKNNDRAIGMVVRCGTLKNEIYARTFVQKVLTPNCADAKDASSKGFPTMPQKAQGKASIAER